MLSFFKRFYGADLDRWLFASFTGHNGYSSSTYVDEYDILGKNAIYLCVEAMFYGCIFEYSRGINKHRGDLVSHAGYAG